MLKTVVSNVYYDEMGRVTRQAVPYSVILTGGVYVDPPSNPTTYTLTTYDAIGRVYQVHSPDGTNQTSTYTIQTENAIPYSVAMFTNARSNTTASWNDALGRTYKIVPLSGPGVTYTYNAADQLVVAQYGPYITTLTYDIAGRKLTMDDPDMGYWTYQYDALGNLNQQTDARGCVTSLQYDKLNRLLGKNFSNASGGTCATIAANTSPVSYTYDQGTNGVGRRTGMEDASGSTLWEYDSRGRLATETIEIAGVGTYTTGWTYNSADLLAGMTYPNGEMVDSSYNSQGLVTAADSGYWTSYASQVKYDETGRMLEWTLGNGVKTSYSYNAWDTQGGRLQSTSSITNLTPATTWQHLAYSYDANGNLTTIQDFVASETLNYSYDALDRLTGVSGAYSQSYGYNATTGNLENKAGQTLAYADINHPHAATGMGSNAYSYDENGSMVSRQISSGTYTLSYDAGGQLVGISGGGMSAAYTYNGDGERVKVAITMSGDTKTSAYIGDYFEVSVGDPIQAQTVTPPNCSISICLYLPLVMTASRAIPAGHAWTSYYSVNGRRVAMRVQSNQDGVAEGVYYFLGDHLGSTTVTLDHSGNLVGELRYSAWGETRYTSGTTPTQRRYTGQLQAEAGLYFYNARWFDGSLGRFVQADTFIPQMANVQSWDRFFYVNNNPLKYTDPSGYRACESRDGYECDPKIAHLWDRADIILHRYGGKNDLEAMVKIINTAASLYDTYEEMIPALSGVFIGIESSNPVTIFNAAFNNTGCSGMGRDPGDCKMNDEIGEFFQDRGFNRDFQDGHNQLFHYWAYLATLAAAQNPSSHWNQLSGFAVGGTANVYHEILDQDDQSTWQDYGLAVSGMQAGLYIGAGWIPPTQLGSYIRNDLGPGGYGGYGIVPLMVNLVPLQGNR